ncbi:hypothetical protein HPB50_007690 [Hyalomma asiaticum]|uniref:Uncharacterized protein n=1 Tax=Hyalomma asiaticum TaxID=266040 RepID=A0ACB7RMD1_HYAAI|nr:hypothetical protein HPB50_007690 [Hyalomma asiaticum]
MAEDDELLIPRQEPASIVRRLNNFVSNAKLRLYVKVAFVCSTSLVVVAAAAFCSATIKCEDVVVHPPNNISAVHISPSRTRIMWTPATITLDGRLVYKADICVTFESCTAGSSGSHCTTLQTQDTWLEFNSNAGTSYCVRLTAVAHFNDLVVNSRPATKEIETPMYAPGDFQVIANTTGPSSVLFTVWVPEIKNGALDRCYITDGGRSFSCNDHAGKESTVMVDDLKPETDYAFSVTFANVHGDQEISTSKVVFVTTPAGRTAFPPNKSQLARCVATVCRGCHGGRRRRIGAALRQSLADAAAQISRNLASCSLFSPCDFPPRPSTAGIRSRCEAGEASLPAPANARRRSSRRRSCGLASDATVGVVLTASSRSCFE